MRDGVGSSGLDRHIRSVHFHILKRARGKQGDKRTKVCCEDGGGLLGVRRAKSLGRSTQLSIEMICTGKSNGMCGP